MKSLFLILALLFTFNSLAVANTVAIDPSISGQTTLTITCEYPIEREDGTLLAINEIARVKFLVEKNGVGGYLPAGENTTACRQVYDMSAIPDGVYLYVATTVDTEGRESVHSATVTAVVKRLALPNAPGGVSGAVN